MYEWDFSFLWGYRGLFLYGLGISLAYTAAVILLGMAVGLLMGLTRLSSYSFLRLIGRAYVEIFRCTPLLVQLVWFFYALPILIGVNINAVTAGVLALSLYGGSFYAEIFRAGIVSIETGQIEAGDALGMTRAQNMRRIVLPQAFKRMVPPLLSQCILQFKNTSLLSTLAIPELLYQGQIIAHDTYRPLETYTFIAIGYLVILFPLTLVVQRIEQKLARSD
jgi:polar amino acid transport system permease protein